jgi:DNA-binding transcriptional ArsR family regulator
MPADLVRRVELDAASLELRRRLGPTAWVVFEELLLTSAGPADACEAEVSVRALAGRLGLAKDTIARALTRLRRAGLVTVSQSRGTTGVFATGTYRLHVPDAITLSDHTTAAMPIASRSSARPRSSRSPRSSGSQLVLAIES